MNTKNVSFQVQEVVESQVDDARTSEEEGETAGERCSEKLVDLVMLLTNKLDMQVETIETIMKKTENDNKQRWGETFVSTSYLQV